MERSLGFGLDDARGEIAQIARPIFSIVMRLLVVSSAPRRQAGVVADARRASVKGQS